MTLNMEKIDVKRIGRVSSYLPYLKVVYHRTKEPECGIDFGGLWILTFGELLRLQISLLRAVLGVSELQRNIERKDAAQNNQFTSRFEIDIVDMVKSKFYVITSRIYVYEFCIGGEMFR